LTYTEETERRAFCYASSVRWSATLKQRLLGAVRPVVSITLLVLAALVLRHELQAYHWRDVIAHMKGIPTTKLLLALSFAAMGYVALTGYDALALRFVKKPLPYRRIALTSFIAYALGHSLTFFGGSAVRYRMLSAWCLRANYIARVIGFVAVTFWLGFFLLGGVVSTGWPMSLGFPSFGISSRVIGLVFLVIFVGYLTLVALGVGPLRLRNFELWVPGPQTTAAQLLLSIVDWLMASLCLYVLLPKSSQLSFFIFLGSYLLAVLAGLVSYLPGGLGVFETAMVLLLRQYLPGDQILGSIFVYRIIYYLLPMFAAVLLLVAYEARERRRQLGRAATVVRRWLIEVAPRAFAITTFIAGAVLLLSGATPALPERLAWLYRTLPLPVIEISTLLGSLCAAPDTRQRASPTHRRRVLCDPRDAGGWSGRVAPQGARLGRGEPALGDGRGSLAVSFFLLPPELVAHPAAVIGLVVGRDGRGLGQRPSARARLPARRVLQ
jgi:phosphatidylglycerol lysyltransferase